MKKYTKVGVSEQQLEDLVRRDPKLIEDGLAYVDHQRPAAGGRLDVLMVDSGKALVVAELKVTEDDGMLLQGLDYFDYVTNRVESFARLYKEHSIDPTQQPRLLLVAPTFSQKLVNCCKWLNLRISLFTYTCLKFEDDNDVTPIFSEREIPEPTEVIVITRPEEHLGYITDTTVRTQFSALLEEVKSWKPGNISTDVIKYGISARVNGRVFAYLSPRRKFFVVDTYDVDDSWKSYAVKSDDDLANVKVIMKAAMERRVK